MKKEVILYSYFHKGHFEARCYSAIMFPSNMVPLVLIRGELICKNYLLDGGLFVGEGLSEDLQCYKRCSNGIKK